MRDMNQISVIIPVYNGGRYLDSCLSALCNSSSPPDEIIVVDNASTDQSVHIAQQYPVTIIHCPGPSGPSAARNVGATHAKGTILFFVDADVVLRQDAIARVRHTFSSQQGIAATFGSYDDQPRAINFCSQYKNLMHHFMHQHSNPTAQTFWSGCGAIRAEVFHRIGGFNETQFPHASIEDIELGTRLHTRGYRIVLDKGLQATHLKEWTFCTLIYTDILFRALPWSKLILEQKVLFQDLNLQRSQKISAGTVGLATILLPFSLIKPSIPFLVLFCLGIVLLLNRHLFGFWVRKKGIRFAISAFPLHLLYFLYCGTTFGLCWVSHHAIKFFTSSYFLHRNTDVPPPPLL